MAREKNWQVYPEISEEINQELIEYPKYLRQILANRGFKDRNSAEAYLNASEPLNDPFLLLNMEKVTKRLLTAIDQEEEIVVYGDYDVDGVSATALMVLVLQKYGAKVERYIPNRYDEGYGLNIESINLLAKKGVKIILTVDCGIRSPREADRARELGIDLIISDHHHPKDELPNAFAVICQKQEGDNYPCDDLAGVGLAFKIAQALFIERSIHGWQAEDWLDLVALGTVADIVPLVGENRVLVRRGINLLRQGKRHGIQSLAGAAGKDYRNITAADIGYILGPRLNAAGRMDSALQAYDLLVSDKKNEDENAEVKKAYVIAQELDNQNSKRQEITKSAQEKAKTQIGEETSENILFAMFKQQNDDESDEAMNGFLAGEKEYPGIVGLVAAKLTEHYYRPSVAGVFENGVVRASCRSIQEFHITQALDECSDLLVRHGGHAMAAGFTVKKENLEVLMDRLRQIADEKLANQELRQTIHVDVVLSPKEVVPTIYKELEKLQPTGMKNPQALFMMRKVKLADVRFMGKEGNHMRFSIPGCPINQAVAFNQAQMFKECKQSNPLFDLVFTIEVNRYFDKETLQINVRDMRIAEDE